MSDPPPPRRRDFVKGLAFGGTAGLLGETAPARADDPPKQPPATDAAKTASEADARMELVLAGFGPKLDEAARKVVRAEVDSITRRAEALRRFELDNGDSPFPVFTPYRDPRS